MQKELFCQDFIFVNGCSVFNFFLVSPISLLYHFNGLNESKTVPVGAKVGVLPDLGHIGMCQPIREGFCTFWV